MDRLDAKRMQVLELLVDKGSWSNMSVADIMTAMPTCVPTEMSVVELIKLFHAKRFRHLLVADDDRHLIGIISDRDVIRCLGPGRSPHSSELSGLTAAGIMSTDLLTADPTMPLERAVSLMMDEGISCLPVVWEDELQGIITTTDLNVVLQLLLQTARQALSVEPVAAVGGNRHD